ncbi:MAG: group II intron reverse transcriptase domain-containing protein [Deltaproteobacteria bacterium]|nr:group II intron reverse transcriptase domain-containing protein [Deltaproteobacteria bacterium]
MLNEFLNDGPVTLIEAKKSYQEIVSRMPNKQQAKYRKRPAPLGGLVDAINNGYYAPGPLSSASIPKPDGTTREILIPSVFDRISGNVALGRLARCACVFPAATAGFLPRRGVQQTLTEAAVALRNNPDACVYKCDIQNFFPSCDHEVALQILRQFTRDEYALYILRCQYDRWGAVHGGLPQGCPASPFLSNFILLEADMLLQEVPDIFCRRYADDIILISNDEASIHHALEILGNQLQRHRLSMHPKKSGMVTGEYVDFLGMRLHRDGRMEIPEEAKEHYRTFTTKNQRLGWKAHYCIAWRWNRFLSSTETETKLLNRLHAGRQQDGSVVVSVEGAQATAGPNPTGVTSVTDQVLDLVVDPLSATRSCLMLEEEGIGETRVSAQINSQTGDGDDLRM